MPKAVKVKPDPHFSANPKKKPSLIVLQHGARRVLITRPATHEKAIADARIHFKVLSGAQSLVLETDELEECHGEKAEIASEAWTDVVDSVTVLYVSAPRPELDRQPCPSSPRPLPAPGLITPPPRTDLKPTITISLEYFRKSELQSVDIILRPTTPMSAVKKVAADRMNIERDLVRLVYRMMRVCDEATAADLNMENGDTILVMLEQVGGKPVIYLWSPTPIEACVTLSLVPRWNFSAVYPVAPITSVKPLVGRLPAQQIKWRVRTHDDGNLTDLRTGVNVNSLFWEAETNSHLPPSSPPTSRPSTPVDKETEIFDPVDVDVTPENGVVISIDDVALYLDKSLHALGLHTEARTSFITYWLPSLLCYKHIALRFIPQAAYSCAAMLNVTPTPDVMTRIFMVFKGVPADQLSDWKHATMRAQQDVSFWRDVVDLDSIERWQDPSLFRVLEWGGMEIRR